MHNKTILIADDDENLRELLCTLFQRLGLNTLLCNDGEQVIETLNEHTQIDAILTELLLPYTDGFDLIRQIRSRPATATIPIIILSDLADENDVAEAFSLQVNDIISKPFQPREMTARVLRWIDHPPLPAYREHY